MESLEEKPKNLVAQARHRMSLLDEIWIYTTDEEGTVPLAKVFDLMHQKYGDTLPLSDKPGNEDYKELLADVLPEYDEERVYISDMKKLVNWYYIVKKFVGFKEEEAAAPAAEAEKSKEEKA